MQKKSLFCKRWDGDFCVEVDIDRLMHHIRTEHANLIKDLADETKEHGVEICVFLCETEPGKLTPTRIQLGDEESIEISDCPPNRGIAVAIHTHRCWEKGVIGDPSPADMIVSYVNPEWDALGIVCPKTRDPEGWVDFTLVTDFHNIPPKFKEKLDRMIEPWIEGDEINLEAMYEKAPIAYLDASIILKRFSKFRYWRFWEDQKPGVIDVEAPDNFEAITEEKLIREGKYEFPESWTPKMREAAKNYCESLGIPPERCYETTRKMFERMRKAFID